jgi:hypothetical protein
MPPAPAYGEAPIRELMDASMNQAVVVWVIRPENLLTHETPARELRHLGARYGSRLRTFVVVSSHRSLVESFLRRERLRNADVREFDPDSFARLYVRGRPAIHVMIRGSTELLLRADAATLRDLTEDDGLEQSIGAVIKKHFPHPQDHSSQ